ncbi:MAG TPA: MFS transporter, partial [Bacteroidota bacterium]|nr:MFS transporter [Bacteroidota bacterium]
MSEQTMTSNSSEESILKKTWNEISQPFVDLIHAPRALWGVNLAYTIEGLSYFGILTYLAIHFSDFIFKGVAHADVWSHEMVMVLTAGIAIAMVVLGFVPDKYGVRFALIFSFAFLLAGRLLMSAAPTIFGLQPNGVWSPLHLITMGGILLVVVGYGVYQPAAYAAVRQFTNPKTASMAYAMLYALMNAGSSLAMLAFLFRDDKFLGLGITGTFWIYTFLTLVSLIATILLLSRKTVANAIARAKEETAAMEQTETVKGVKSDEPKSIKADDALKVPLAAWIVLAGILAAIIFRVPSPWSYYASAAAIFFPIVVSLLPAKFKTPIIKWVATHPLSDIRFFFFIFALMPVQTLFTYNWLVLPQYISRAYSGWIGEYYEVASNANPILIFILVPVITALTYKKNVYTMMIIGTLVMSSSAFILALGPNPITLCCYIMMMTIGEALWSARFLQYATEIAPPERAGQYQGVAQLPWFLTKFLVPLLYSGQMMERYCPADGSKDTGSMWFIFGLIAIVSP